MDKKEFFELLAKMRAAEQNYFVAAARKGFVSEKEIRGLLFVCKIYKCQIDEEIQRVFEEQRKAIEPKLNFEDDV